MKSYLSLFILFLFMAKCFSQEKIDNIDNQILPKSIYTPIINANEINSSFTINNRLNLKSFKFVTLDIQDIEDGYFSIWSQNIDRTPSKFIYESYVAIYNDLNLKKSFFKISDLYRLHK